MQIKKRMKNEKKKTMWARKHSCRTNGKRYCYYAIRKRGQMKKRKGKKHILVPSIPFKV